MPQAILSAEDDHEGHWIADLGGFLLGAPRSHASSAGFGSLFLATPHRIVAGDPAGLEPRERLSRCVAVDAVHGTLTPVNPAGPEVSVPRSLWINVAILTLLLRGGLLVHAAGAALVGRGLLLVASSGVGKSTLSRWVESAYPGSVLCDERIAVRREEGDAWTMAGTPWSSSAGIARRRTVPLSAIVFLEQAPANEIRPLTAAQAFERILPMVSIPWHETDLANLGTTTLGHLLGTVPAHLYRVVNAPSAAEHLRAWALTLPAPIHVATTPLHPDGDATCH